ncbi:lasso peptide biosynthesis B2 protein [Spirosoma sp. KCTC 42546]|uniref:lasso peptide biosynthesis B2 protein n=1 Tax=Spirosoma sp. KCTC 42546 TaxID=2520506 RepID=UPI00115830C8|nr:lasso peptide biosynthesis B2 protein [Spirosoma sp. KCTC 42546]QDK82414.1 lasso peptide biosynthesis B2 protein [Spirosoma sp. KCTC 42546]
MNSVIGKINIIFGLSTRQKKLLIMTFFVSIYTYLLMKFFKKYALFQIKGIEGKARINDNLIIDDICSSIRMISKYVPYENVCRHQAYQAKLICTYYKIAYQIFVGFKRDEAGNITGHAWTIAQGKIITGFCNPEEYVIMSVYS